MDIERYREVEENVRRGGAQAGVYFVSQYTIRLGWEVGDLFDAQGRAQPGENASQTAILLHEYTHYLHNVSTLVGAEQASAMLAMLGVYAVSLFPTKDGMSVGFQGLSSGTQDLHGEALRGFDHFLRTQNHGPSWADVEDAKLHGWRETRGSASETALRRACITFQVSPSSGVPRAQDLFLDTQVIEEGLGYGIESMFMEDHGMAAMPARWFPYKVLGTVVRHYVPDATALDVMRLGIIAMNTTNSGAWLMEVLEGPDAEKFVKRSDELASLLDWKRVFPEARRHVLEKLDVLAKSYKGRGLLGYGVEAVVETTRTLLERRLAEPFFELPVGGERIDWAGVFAGMNAAAPCEMLVERSAEKDDLLTFGSEPSEKVEGRRALDLAIEALKAHLHPDKKLLPTTAVRPLKCRLYNWCPNRSRTETPERCQSEPWLYIANRSGDRCFFGHGMLGLIADISVARPAAK